MHVTLTFDDGPGPSTSTLLDVLAAHGEKATFFLLGRNIEALPDVARRIVRDGHTVGNHTYSHARPDAITREELIDEIARTDLLLEGIAGDQSFLVRLPYGPLGDDPRVRWLERMGREHVHWTADFADWTATDPAELARRMHDHVIEQAARGLDAVLDLHDASKVGAERAVTVEAVRLFLAMR